MIQPIISGRFSPERPARQLDDDPPGNRRRPTPDDDADALRAGPPDAAVRFRHLAGTWPTSDELAALDARRTDSPSAGRSLADVLHHLIGDNCQPGVET